MDQGTLVERQIDDGAKIVEKLRTSGFDVAAAWWMKASDEGLWFLYVASREADGDGILEAYRKLHTVIGSLGPLWVDRFRVRLVGPQNPIARDVIGILNRYPGQTPTLDGWRRLGDVTVDGSYIYPLAAAA